MTLAMPDRILCMLPDIMDVRVVPARKGVPAGPMAEFGLYRTPPAVLETGPFRGVGRLDGE